LVLRGELKSTRYVAREFTYGLGIFSFLPAIAGAPIGHLSNQLTIEFVLEERVSGASLWHKSYCETKDATFFLYWMPPEFYYDKLFGIIMRDVAKSMQAELPAVFLRATEPTFSPQEVHLPTEAPDLFRCDPVRVGAETRCVGTCS
jgi:hypothetical protein